LLTIALYLGAVLTVVFIGYLITNPRPGAVTELGIPDALVGLTIASVYIALMSAIILRQDIAGLYGKPQERFRRIEDWLEALDEAEDINSEGDAQVAAYQRVVNDGEELLDALRDAKTNEGNRLCRVFEAWLTDFRERSSSVSREAMLTGETGNDRLIDKYQTLTWVRKQVADIGGDEVARV
jgi:hypothetical protein